MPGPVRKFNPDIEKERRSGSFDVEEFALWWNGGAEKLNAKRALETDTMPGPVRKFNPDIEKERRSGSFDVEEFALWWNGGAEKLNAKRALESIIFEDPELEDEVPPEYTSYQDMYDNAIKKTGVLMRKIKKLQDEKNPGGRDIYPQMFEEALTGRGMFPQLSPFLLHISMFQMSIKGQGTPEQIKKWIPRAMEFQVIGTYAQTELGHGTFLRGLETRADFDRESDEFILNSPTITAYKWWPGGLGHTANYAIVAAQLYIDNKPKGIQLFIVQLRDEQTHMPLSGVILGDIGNKMAFQTVNNGYLGFAKYRIPRTNMLMKNAQVHRDGTFVKAIESVLTYFTMVEIRVSIVLTASRTLAQASTIATRYSAVRRQSPINPKEPEHQIIDHVTQQMKLFPHLAKGIAIKLNADYLYSMLNEIKKELSNGNLERLPEMHALVSCLKVVSSKDAAAGVETLRLACGGHGYMLSSGLPALYNFATAAMTYEGENTVMLLQTARFLVKSWSLALKGEKLVPTVAYLSEMVNSKQFSKWDGSWSCIVNALQFVAANKLRVAYNNLERRKNQNMVVEEAFNLTSIELASVAEMHGRSFLAQTALEQIKSLTVSHALKTVLNDLFELYFVGICFEMMSDILRFIQLTEDDISKLQSRLEVALEKIRPNAVAIVDGFDFHDRNLNSVLGCFDGNVYERIFESASKNPMNKVPVQKSFELYLKPIMKSNL